MSKPVKRCRFCNGSNCKGGPFAKCFCRNELAITSLFESEPSKDFGSSYNSTIVKLSKEQLKMVVDWVMYRLNEMVYYQRNVPATYAKEPKYYLWNNEQVLKLCVRQYNHKKMTKMSFGRLRLVVKNIIKTYREEQAKDYLRRQVDSAERTHDQESCPICLEEMTAARCTLECKHQFCTPCFVTLTQAQVTGQVRCPYCRQLQKGARTL